jgi:phosphoglycolate phosphatase
VQHLLELHLLIGEELRQKHDGFPNAKTGASGLLPLYNRHAKDSFGILRQLPVIRLVLVPILRKITPMTPDFEILRPDLPRGRFRSVLFDFDGTLSLIREGWPQVMIPMMVAVLKETGTSEEEPALAKHVEEFVMRLNGRQTIYQMIQLAEEVKQRGGKPLDPLAYKHRYHDLLMDRIHGRLDALATGRATPHDWTVPGSHALLDELRRRGLTLYLASGTDVAFVRREAGLLGLTPYFGEHIYGALDDYQNFSKKMIIERILGENNLQGEELIGFGDGFVEIEEVKRVGGVAVAVASDEVKRQGIHAWKRDRLVRAGADVVIGDYRQREELMRLLFDVN